MGKAPRDSIAEIIAKLPKGTVGLTDPEYYQKRLVQAYPKADEIIPLLNLAYCAGIVDGEGSIGIRSRKYRTKKGTESTYFTPVLTVEMTDKVAVDCVARLVNGSIFHAQDKRYTKNGTLRKPSWRFLSSSRKALIGAELLLPYLQIKKPHAELIIEFYSIPKLHHSYSEERKTFIRNRQLEIYNKMRELHKR